MNDRQISKLFWAIKASLVAILLYVAIAAVLTPSQPGVGLKPKAVSGDERIDEAIMEPEPPAPVDYSTIVENDIFAGPVQETEAHDPSDQVATVEALPSAEELGLRLVGVIAGGPVASRAIIENTAAKTASPYKIGSTVASATVESIEPDRVVLLHAGRKLVLHLHAGAAATDPKPVSQNEASQAATTKAAQVQPPSARLGYVEELFREATIKPHVKNGKTEGLEITGLEQTPLAKLFGLRNGDVVTTLNGQNLTSKQKAFQVLKKARTQPKIDLELLRKGKTKEMSFDL